ncbi:DUF421 domain-containing protein [Halonatronum saccharophilum]|uniref:DUF421 domain-containing protein n=1 Tax=Halonatronum saccharophilum TaxID=150060 RepID=UPI0004886071|nr:DUF421 domain-containing protein [Halonatronum saccharophilum]
MSNLFLRTVYIYFITLTAIRLMGKREVGELSPFDLVVSLMIAELGVIVIEERSLTLWQGILPIFTLAGIEILMSYLSLKSNFLRRILNGRPVILIKNGELMKGEMKKSRYNIHDLMRQLRKEGIFEVSDVEFAILETSGELSILPKSQKRGLTPEHLHIPTEYEGLSLTLIADGEIDYNALNNAGLDEEWLLKELRKREINSPKDVLLATLESDGNIYISTNEE